MQTSLDNLQQAQPMHSTSKYTTTLTYCNCPHRIHHPDSDCRHILKLKYENLQKIDNTIMESISEHREQRDKGNTGLQGAVDIQDHYRHEDLASLMEIALNIAKEKGTVCSDDVHTVTNEAYKDDKIIGTVFAVLVRSGAIEEIARKPTERKCAHGRKISIYKLKENTFNDPHPPISSGTLKKDGM